MDSTIAMKSLDTSTTTTNVGTAANTHVAQVRSSSLVNGIITLERSYLADPGPVRSIAGYALSCILTRPEMESSNILKEYMDYCIEQFTHACIHRERVINTNTKDSIHFSGVVYSLVQVLKRGNRLHLLRYTDNLLKHIILLTQNDDTVVDSTSPNNDITTVDASDPGEEVGEDESAGVDNAGEAVDKYISSSVLRKLLCKLIQRIGRHDYCDYCDCCDYCDYCDYCD